jgi:hypothetical protein
MVGINLDFLKNQNISGNAQRLGMSSTSMLDNMMVYIFIFAIFLILTMIIGLFYVFTCLR